jgi:hypothetical protein
MHNEINKVEKLTKEERNILEKNLRICFDVIVESTGAKSFDIENDMRNKEKFLKEFSPWHQEKGQELIQKFVDNVNNDNSTDDFSWFDILDDDVRWQEFGDNALKKQIKENKQKFLNMRYQIPEHCHGDIDKAIIFHCMENPRGYVSDELWGEKKESVLFLKDYYEKTADNRKEKNRNGSIEEIIKERYKLKHRYNLEKFDSKFVKKVIFSEESALESDFNYMFNIFNKEDFEKKYNFAKWSKDLIEFYFLKNFYYQLIQDKKVPNIKELEGKKEQVEKFSKQFCNLEVYPFSGSDPYLNTGEIGDKFIKYSDLSRLGIYIVLRRVYLYLINKKENNEEKIPVFVLRKYDKAWKNLFVKIFEEVKEKDQRFDKELVLSLLEKGFFYCQTGPRGGGITDGNVISVPNFKTIDRKDSKLFEDTKMKDFNSIKSLLTKVEM